MILIVTSISPSIVTVYCKTNIYSTLFMSVCVCELICNKGPVLARHL